MSSLFSNCFGRSREPPLKAQGSSDLIPHAGHREVDNVNPAKCVFCNVTPDRFRIVLQDDELICFSDRSPGAAIHLLVIPRTHIANVQSLTHKDVELVRQMQALGNKALDLVSDAATTTTTTTTTDAAERRFGFHIPPIRSVDHLHLHCLQLPFRNRYKAIKYRVAEPPNRDYLKGWSWFVEWKQTCALLEARRKIKIYSC